MFSREKKDDFLLRNQSKLTKMVVEMDHPLSQKLGNIYSQLSESHKQNELEIVLQEMTKLYLYAYDNFVDIDRNFEEYNIRNIIFDCLSQKMPIEIRKATVAFLSNVFQRPKTMMLEQFVNEGIIPLLKSMLNENIESLCFPVLQCATNIASDSVEYRDDVFNHISLDLLSFLISSSNRKIQKTAARLVAAYCSFPGDQKFLSSTLDFFMNTFINSSHNLFPTLIGAMISFINSYDACKLIIKHSEENENSILNFFQSLLGEKQNSKTITMTLLFLDKLSETIKSTLDIDYLKVIELLESDDDKIVLYSLRVLSNALVLDHNLCSSVMDTDSMKLILDIVSNGDGNSRIEAIYLLTILVRNSTNQIFEDLCKNFQLVAIFVDALNMEDPALVDSILCALTRMMESEVSNTTQKKIRDQFAESNGNNVIEMLINSENQDISQQAYAFQNIILEERQGFKFT